MRCKRSFPLLVAGLALLLPFLGATGIEARTVGLKISVLSRDATGLKYEFGLTAYDDLTTSVLPSIKGGREAPGLDFGDGSAIQDVTLALDGVGTGPGGTNVYRSTAALAHSYAEYGSYTVRAETRCSGCYVLHYGYVTPGGTVWRREADIRPDVVLAGQLAQPFVNTKRIPAHMTLGSGTYANSVVFQATGHFALSDTLALGEAASNAPIPALSVWGVGLLGLALLLGGLALHRQTRKSKLIS